MNNDQNSNITVVSGSSFNLEDGRISKYRSEWNRRSQEFDEADFPIHLDIESTSRCNLKCKFCLTIHSEFERGDLTRTLHKEIISESISEGLSAAKYNWRGEPLLNEEIFAIITDAKEAGLLDAFFNSNATLLSKEAADKLMNCGLDRLIISFEGVSKSIYEENRVNANFEETVNNVKFLANLKKEMNKEKPVIRLQTVAVSDDIKYIKEYENFWQDYADEITCIDLRDEEKDYRAIKSSWICPYPFLRLTIAWNGKIFLCPFCNHSTESAEAVSLGEVCKDSIKDIWHGDILNKIRNLHKEGNAHMHPDCANCSYRGTEVLKLESNNG
jgi:radical SAM protein with 4Fe4S-binding SPASM domain